MKEGGERASPPGDKGRASEVVRHSGGSRRASSRPGGQRVGRQGAGPGAGIARGAPGGGLRRRVTGGGPRGGRPGGAGDAGETQAHAADKERGWPGPPAGRIVEPKGRAGAAPGPGPEGKVLAA